LKLYNHSKKNSGLPSKPLQGRATPYKTPEIGSMKVVFEIKHRSIKPCSDAMLNNSKKIKRSAKIKNEEAKVSLMLHDVITIIYRNRFNLNTKRLYIG
jgi:hypothetical protein